MKTLKLKPHEHDALARPPRRRQATYVGHFCACVKAWGCPRPNCPECHGRGVVYRD